MRAVDRLEVRSNPLPQSSSASRPFFRLVSRSCTRRGGAESLGQASRQLKHPGNSTDGYACRLDFEDKTTWCGCVTLCPVVDIRGESLEGERSRRFEVSTPCRALLHLPGNRMFPQLRRAFDRLFFACWTDRSSSFSAT